jgi:hypothetical protein
MRKLLTFCLLLPFFCAAQSNNEVISNDSQPNQASVHCSSWQALNRPTLRNPLCTFYRFLYNDGAWKIELKVSAGGQPFVVAKNAPLELETEEGEIISLYNEHYQVACSGCGSRTEEASRLGVTLSFPIEKKSIDLLCDSYLGHFRLYLADFMLGSDVSLNRCETFREELTHFRDHVND